MDLRAGAPAAERRTRSRSLRGPILARTASPRTDDDDRLRLPSTSPAQNGKAGKKESTARRLNRHCPQLAKPSSNSSPGYRQKDARTAENGFAAKSNVSKSAKVVLGPADIRLAAREEQSVVIAGAVAVRAVRRVVLTPVREERRSPAW